MTLPLSRIFTRRPGIYREVNYPKDKALKRKEPTVETSSIAVDNGCQEKNYEIEERSEPHMAIARSALCLDKPVIRLTHLRPRRIERFSGCNCHTAINSGIPPYLVRDNL